MPKRPDAGPPMGALEDLFLEAGRAIRHRWIGALAPWDIAPQQARALRLVATHQPIRPGVLAERLRIAPRSVTDVVSALEARGYLQREPDPVDRRATAISLTEAGTAVDRAVTNARQSAASDYFACLPKTDRTTLTRILNDLAHAAERQTSEPTQQ